MKEQRNEGNPSQESTDSAQVSAPDPASGSAGRWSYWIRSGFYMLFSRFSLQLFGLLGFIILVDSFGEDTDSFGTWVLYLMVGAFIEVGRNGLIQNGLIKFLSSASEHENPQIQTAATTINIGLTAIIGTALYFSSDLLANLVNAPQLASILPIYCLTTVALIPFTQANCTQQANLSFKGTFWSSFVRQGSFFGYILYTWWSDGSFTLINLAWAQMITSAMGSLVTMVAGWDFFHFSRRIDTAKVRQLLQFGIYSFGASLSTMLYKTIDRIMLGILLGTGGTTAVALMDPAIRITNVMEMPLYAMAAVLYPKSARKAESEGPEAVRALYEKAVGATLVVVLPVCLVVLLFPQFFIRVLTAGNKAYAESIPILTVTILYTLFIPFARQFGTVLDSLGKPNWNFAFVISAAMLNIATNYFYIAVMDMGVIGAAYGTLTTIAIKFIAEQTVLSRVLGVKPYRPLVYAWSFAKQGLTLGIKILSNPRAALNR